MLRSSFQPPQNVALDVLGRSVVCLLRLCPFCVLGELGFVSCKPFQQQPQGIRRVMLQPLALMIRLEAQGQQPRGAWLRGAACGSLSPRTRVSDPQGETRDAAQPWGGRYGGEPEGSLSPRTRVSVPQGETRDAAQPRGGRKRYSRSERVTRASPYADRFRPRHGARPRRYCHLRFASEPLPFQGNSTPWRRLAPPTQALAVANRP